MIDAVGPLILEIQRLQYCFGNHSTGFSSILDFALPLVALGLPGLALSLLASFFMIKIVDFHFDLDRGK